MKRLILGAWIGSIGLCATPLAVLHAQGPGTGGTSPSETRTVRPRSALETAIEYHLKGDFDTAEAIFAEADKYQQYLNAEEKAKLVDYRKRNQEAVGGRKAALSQLTQADQLVRDGKGDAEPLLKSLRTSKYLNTQERQQVAMLDQQYKQKGGSKRRNVMDWMSRDKDQKETTEKPDTEAMVTDARRALERGDVDGAEKLAKQAESVGHKSLFPWSDTPAKVLKDAQASRAKMTPKVADMGTKPGTATKPAAGVVAKMTEAVRPAAATDNTPQARELLKQASQAAKAGDTATAKRLLADAEAMKPNIPWWETTSPDSVKKDISKAEQASIAKAPPIMPNKPTVNPVATKPEATKPTMVTTKPEVIKPAMAATKPEATKPTMPAPVVDTASAAKMQPAEAKELVKQAKQALDKNDYERAEALAKQARLVPGVKYGLFEDTPDKILAEAIKGRDSGKGDKASAVLADARRKLEAGQYDEAEKLTYQAEAMKPNYGIWHRGERHDKLRDEIRAMKKSTGKTALPPLLDPVAARQQSISKPSGFAGAGATPSGSAYVFNKPNGPGVVEPTRPVAVDPAKQEALNLLAQARLSLNRGDGRTALQFAAQAKSMGVSFSADEDSPEAVLAAVKAVQRSGEDRRDPVAADAMKKQALQLVADARLLQKENRIIEALTCAQQAKKLGAAFAPNEDGPDAVLGDLRASCELQVKTYSQAANTLSERGQHQEAERYWRYVFQVAQTYGLDTSAIGDEIVKVQQKAVGTASVANNDALSQGQEILAQAENEMTRGDLIKARNFANALYTGPYGMKDKARDLLAGIDDAEHKALLKRTRLAYDQGVRAYLRKDYAVAAGYFQSIDVRLLDNDKRAYAAELMSSREMHAHNEVKVAKAVEEPMTGDEGPAGKATITDNPPKSIEQPKPSLAEDVRKRQGLELQRLRQESLASQNQANKLAGAGDLEGAVDALQTAMGAIKGAGLDPEQTAPLLRQLEDRHKKFTIMREQVAFTKLQQSKFGGRLEEKQKSMLFEESKKEQVSDLMKKYQTYFKEGKYEDAYVMAAKAHELDPDSPATDAAMFRANMMRNQSEDKSIKERTAAGIGQALRDIGSAAAPDVSDSHPVSYPGDFKDKSNRRLKLYNTLQPISPLDREVTNKLNTVISVDFKDKPLVDVINELRSLTNINIVPDLPFIEADGVSLEHPISIRLDSVPFKTVLNRLLHNAKLTYAVRDGVLLVTTPAGQRGKLVRTLFPVADLVSAIDRFTPPDANQISATGLKSVTDAVNSGASNPSTLQWTGVKGGANNGFNQYMNSAEAHTAPGKAHRRPGQSMEDILMQLIKNTIEPASWDDMGGSGHIEYYPLGMSLVISQTPDVQDQVQQLLERLRELQDLQVTVEVRFITLTEEFYERIGIDFDVELNDNQTRFDSMVATNNFAPPGHLNEPDHLDNVIVGLTPTGNFTSDLDIPINSSSFNLATPPFGGFPNSPGANGGLDLGIAFLSSIEVYLFMEAAQGDTRQNVLTAPKITLFNGQTANINSSTQDFFVTQVIPITNPFTGFTTFLPINTPFPTQVDLTVQAVVTADRHYVQLTLQPIITRTRAGGTFQPVPGITLQQPSFDILTVGTTVSVPDGGTILMGGLKSMSEGRNEYGPPILSKIPYINRLFRNTGYGRESTSLMIMVTPRIIIPEEEEERLGNTFAF